MKSMIFFWSNSFNDHVNELMREEGLSKEKAEAETRKELDEMLPQGRDTLNNYLLSVKLDGCVIGIPMVFNRKE